MYYLECFRLTGLIAYVLEKSGNIEFIILPVVLMILIDDVFSIKHVYNNYVLRYEKI